MGSPVTFEVPAELEGALRAAGYSREKLSEEARSALAVSLFSTKALSLGQAAQFLGADLWRFIEVLGRRGVAVADYDREEAQREVAAAQWLATTPKRS
jgi:predicted HTH domain antitoxin